MVTSRALVEAWRRSASVRAPLTPAPLTSMPPPTHDLDPSAERAARVQAAVDARQRARAQRVINAARRLPSAIQSVPNEGRMRALALAIPPRPAAPGESRGNESLKSTLEYLVHLQTRVALASAEAAEDSIHTRPTYRPDLISRPASPPRRPRTDARRPSMADATTPVISKTATTPGEGIVVSIMAVTPHDDPKSRPIHRVSSFQRRTYLGPNHVDEKRAPLALLHFDAPPVHRSVPDSFSNKDIFALSSSSTQDRQNSSSFGYNSYRIESGNVFSRGRGAFFEQMQEGQSGITPHEERDKRLRHTEPKRFFNPRALSISSDPLVFEISNDGGLLAPKLEPPSRK